MQEVPVMRPLLATSRQVLPYLDRMDVTRVYGNFGPLVMELEDRYAARFGVPASHVVACSSGTLGLQGAVAVSSAEVFHCPAWTFPASALSVLNAGKDLLFRDVSAVDGMIDASGVPDEHGLLPVLPFGAEIDLSRWAGREEVVIDAAASGGAHHRDLSALPRGWAVVVSLHATKVLGAGEGGIAFFGDASRAERFRAYTGFGFQDRRETDFRSTNGKMPEVVAAYALAALDHWDDEESDWRRARALVVEAEQALSITSPFSRGEGVNPYWIGRFDDAGELDRAEATLRAAGVGTRRWWPTSCVRMPAFEEGWGATPTPAADRLSGTMLGLPFFRDLTSQQVDRVVSALAGR